MERKKHVAKPSPPKQSPEKTKHRTGGFLERIHGPTTFSLRALLRSFFSCSGAGGECADDHATYNDNVTKRPVVSPTKPHDASKHKRTKHASSTAPQVQHGSTIALGIGSKKLQADDNSEDWQIIANNELCDTRKQEIRKQEPPLPNISEPSTIMSESLRSSLCTHLPTLIRGREWVLLYSTWKHGISLRTLYRRSAHLSGPWLLVVEDSKGAVFGGLLTGPLNPTSKLKFQGTHDSFVFTNADTNFGLFRSTGLNRYYFLCTNDMLAFGGGGTFALRLDGDLYVLSSMWQRKCFIEILFFINGILILKVCMVQVGSARPLATAACPTRKSLTSDMWSSGVLHTNRSTCLRKLFISHQRNLQAFADGIDLRTLEANRHGKAAHILFTETRSCQALSCMIM